MIGCERLRSVLPMKRKTCAVLAGLAGAVCLAAIPPAAAHTPSGHHPQVRLILRSPVIDLFHSASVRVAGLTGRRVEARLLGATDESGLAYEWTPYRWQRLRSVQGTWRGVLPSPALRGIYRVQLRLDHGRTWRSSRSWLLRVFPRRTLTRGSFPTPQAAIRDFVAHLRGDEVLVALRQWPQAGFDHRDPRLHRIFVIAYAPRGDDQVSSRLGLFVTTFRNGYQGRWRVLAATTQPYD